MKGVPFLSKMVYKSVRGWSAGWVPHIKLSFSGGCVLQLFNVFSQYLTYAAFVILADFVFDALFLSILLK